MNVKSNRRGRWNIADVLIILFVAVMIMALGYVMLFADGNLLDRIDTNGDTKTVIYTPSKSPNSPAIALWTHGAAETTPC